MNAPLTLTVPEAASLLGRSRDFVRRLIADGLVAGTKHRGRWYLNAASLDEWVRMGSVDPAPPEAGYVIPAVVKAGRRAA